MGLSLTRKAMYDRTEWSRVWEAQAALNNAMQAVEAARKLEDDPELLQAALHVVGPKSELLKAAIGAVAKTLQEARDSRIEVEPEP